MKRNKFSLSHYRLMTADMGLIVPMTWYEALPGDTIQQATSALIRVSPLLSPVMHPVNVRIHHWFVPYRLIWEDFEKFVTGGDDGDFTAAVPKMSESSITAGSLHDYLGIPPGDYSGLPLGNIVFSCLPHRAYQLIYNEHYRDQDLITEIPSTVASGDDTTTQKDLLRPAWPKDFYSTIRPFEQKGTEINIPLGDTAPIIGLGAHDQTFAAGGNPRYETGASGTTTYVSEKILNASGDSQALVAEEDPNNPGFPGIFADLSEATGINVNELRMALAQQRYMEARAMFGSRYTEYLRYLVGPGFTPSDARLQNPEYIGGGRSTISFSEVLQTQRTDTDQTPLGHMGGHGISAMRTNRYRRFIGEHGLIMSVMSVIPKAIYRNSLHRKFNRLTKEDYFQKELQFTGDRAVENKEIYSEHTAPTETFGYQSRYDSYRGHPSSVAGEFNDTLNYWHYARDFEAEPALNQSYIEANPTKRVNADAVSHCLYIMANHSVQARRIVSKHAMPRTF